MKKKLFFFLNQIFNSFFQKFLGFGCFMRDQISDPQSYGIYIVDRRDIGTWVYTNLYFQKLKNTKKSILIFANRILEFDELFFLFISR